MTVNDAGLCFIDTNIWLYAFIEEDDVTKSTVARQLLQTIEPVISTQVINEVCVNLLKRQILTEEQVRTLIASFYEKYQVVELTRSVLSRASDLRQRYSLSFWDSMIIASALEADITTIYSEDMHHGLMIANKLQIRNPFSPAQD